MRTAPLQTSRACKHYAKQHKPREPKCLITLAQASQRGLLRIVRRPTLTVV